MKKLICFNMVLMLLISMFLTGCGAQDESQKKEITKKEKKDTLIYGSEFDAEKVNPILEGTGVDSLVFRGLMKFDENNKPQYDIAKDVKISEDGLTYDITMRDDVIFHDDSKLKSEDIVFTIKSILDPKVNSSIVADFSVIKDIVAVNDYEVKITLNKPFPPLLDKLTIGIVPKHCFANEDINNASFNKQPIGAGPYKLIKWEDGKALTFEVFDKYYKEKAKIKKVVFKMLPDYNVRAMQLQTGEIDLAYIEPSQVKKIEENKNIKVYKVDTADYRAVMYNFKNEMWKDVNVRKAFNYAVDRKAIVDGILHGYGTEAYSPLQLNKYFNKDVSKYSYDLNKANELLESAGWKMNKDNIREKNGKKLEFKLTVPVTDEVRVNIANYLSSQYKKIGVNAQVEALPWSGLKNARRDSFVIGFGSQFDADDHTFRVFNSKENGENGWNIGNYNNSKVDELLEKGRTNTDEEVRKDAYYKFQEELFNDPAYNFLVYLKALYAVNKDVNGIKETVLGHHGAGFLWNIEEWEINGN